MSTENLCTFERDLYGDWAYYEKQYFDQDKLKDRCEQLFGWFDYSEISEHVNQYIKSTVYYLALLEWQRDHADDDYEF